MKSLRIFLAGSILVLLSAQTSPAATQALDYDANGNLISGKGKYYEYNDANKLVRVREGSKEGPVIAQFWYDYQGQRVKKEENGITTYYLGKQYEERRGPSTNEKTNFYFAAGQRVARKTQKDAKAAETFYYFNNHLGSTEVVTNAAGTVLDRMTYDPFGSIRTTGSERYSYTGKEKDSATGQYYYEARYYDALGHHFTQADTVTPNVYDPQSLNRYAYVVNNPIKYIDPSGHEWWKPSTWSWLNHLKNGLTSSNMKQKDVKPSSSLNTSLPNGEINNSTVSDNLNKNSDSSNTNHLLNAENNLENYRSDYKYSQYKDNCKRFLDEVYRDETGSSLPKLCANNDCTVYNHHAKGNINDAEAGDYIQYYGDNGGPPHTAKVLSVDKINNQINTITVLDANYQSKGTNADIRIRRNVDFSDFKYYYIYD